MVLNTAISQEISPNTAARKYCDETRCNTETTTLYIKFGRNDIEISIKKLLIKAGNVCFWQNK